MVSSFPVRGEQLRLSAILALLFASFAGVALAQTPTTYTYDVHGRLVTSASPSAITTYTYDNAGNRIQVAATAVTTPVAAASSATVAFNSTGNPILLSLSGGAPVSVAVTTAASHGTATASGAAITYTPTTSYYGGDTFQYIATNTAGTSAPATVTITVNPPAPTASGVSLSAEYNTAGSAALSPSGVYTSLAVASNPAHGSASISGTTATYTPTSGYYGGDSFTYNATGPGGTSAAATVTVSVGNPPAPTVAGVSLSAAYNNAGSAGLAPSGVYTSLAVASNPSHGSASISGTTATYTPTSGYYGGDSFTYNATGPGGTSAAATVTVTVGLPNPPTVSGISLAAAYNTAGSAPLAPSGVYSSLAVASNPSHGSASISGTTATYTPTSGYSGGDSFTYTATGPGGTSAPATVTVTVGNAPAPTVSAVSLSTAYNTAGSAALSPQGVYNYLSVASNPAHGSASISGTTATYTPTSGYYGGDSFTYNATGPGGTSAAATVTVSVGNPPAPTVSGVSLSAAYQTAGSTALAPSGVYSSLAVASNPSHGSASISGTTATYTPTTGYSGGDSFTYNATGPGGTSAAATVTVAVGLPNPPTAVNQTATFKLSTSGGAVNVLNGDTDPYGYALTIVSVGASSDGTVGYPLLVGGAVSYTALADGTATFTYTISDGHGATATATVTVTVIGSGSGGCKTNC